MSFRLILHRVGETLGNVTERQLDSPELVAGYWHEIIATDPVFEGDKEHLFVILVNTRHRALCHHLVSVGSLSESIAHPREILRPAIVAAAFGFVLVHNHPSGDPEPSEADRRLTRRIVEGAELLQIKLVDHVVIGDPAVVAPGFASFRELGLL